MVLIPPDFDQKLLHGSFVDLGLGSLPFLTAMLSMGLVISSVARTRFQATQMSFFFLPSMLLSGFMSPCESMPELAQAIGQILPPTHFLSIVRGVLLKGASLEALWGEVAAVMAFTAAALALRGAHLPQAARLSSPRAPRARPAGLDCDSLGRER